MGMLVGERYNPAERKLQKAAMLFFGCYFVKYTSWILYIQHPPVFAALAPLFYLSHTTTGAVLYYIVFRVTTGHKQRAFPRVNIVLPLVIPVMLGIWMLFIPFGVPLGIVEGFRELNPEYPLFSRIFASQMAAEVLFTAGYLLLSFARIGKYRRSLPEASREKAQYKLRWLDAMIIIISLMWVQPFIAKLTSMQSVLNAFWFPVLGAAAVSAVMVVLLYNIQRHNYPPLFMKSKAKSVPAAPASRMGEIMQEPSMPTGKVPLEQLSRKELDNYFRREKPYLRPDLKLGMLAAEMGLRRDELSKVINTTYNMNFSALIATLRLKELDRLRKQERYKDLPLSKVTPLAGFPYYKSYLRARSGGGTKEKANDNTDL